jgi:hypothetical protein
MLDINAVERVIDKRSRRGATDESLVRWLEGLKKGAWKRYPGDINRLIGAIKQKRGARNDQKRRNRKLN